MSERSEYVARFVGRRWQVFHIAADGVARPVYQKRITPTGALDMTTLAVYRGEKQARAHVAELTAAASR
jgi:hypothetical protein